MWVGPISARDGRRFRRPRRDEWRPARVLGVAAAAAAARGKSPPKRRTTTTGGKKSGAKHAAGRRFADSQRRDDLDSINYTTYRYLFNVSFILSRSILVRWVFSWTGFKYIYFPCLDTDCDRPFVCLLILLQQEHGPMTRLHDSTFHHRTRLENWVINIVKQEWFWNPLRGVIVYYILLNNIRRNCNYYIITVLASLYWSVLYLRSLIRPILIWIKLK